MLIVPQRQQQQQQQNSQNNSLMLHYKIPPKYRSITVSSKSFLPTVAKLIQDAKMMAFTSDIALKL